MNVPYDKDPQEWSIEELREYFGIPFGFHVHPDVVQALRDELTEYPPLPLENE